MNLLSQNINLSRPPDNANIVLRQHQIMSVPINTQTQRCCVVSDLTKRELIQQDDRGWRTEDVATLLEFLRARLRLDDGAN